MSGTMADLPEKRPAVHSVDDDVIFGKGILPHRIVVQTHTLPNQGVNNTPIIEAVDSKDSCTRSIV